MPQGPGAGDAGAPPAHRAQVQVMQVSPLPQGPCAGDAGVPPLPKGPAPSSPCSPRALPAEG